MKWAEMTTMQVNITLFAFFLYDCWLNGAVNLTITSRLKTQFWFYFLISLYDFVSYILVVHFKKENSRNSFVAYLQAACIYIKPTRTSIEYIANSCVRSKISLWFIIQLYSAYRFKWCPIFWWQRIHNYVVNVDVNE
jgi:hypothetical protein